MRTHRLELLAFALVLSACSDPVRELADFGGSLIWFEYDPPAPDPNNHLLASKGTLFLRLTRVAREG